MSRPSSVAGRNLTLTEELEKLEQSITLTLQEIDHNFSRAHQIVTSSILPVVEQYAEHSKAVWEGSKFWKQFFEASANVSLSGYEEQAGFEEEAVSRTQTGEDDSYEETTEVTATQHQHGMDPRSPEQQDSVSEEEDPSQASALDSPSMVNSTPRATTSTKAKAKPAPEQQQKATFASYASPYEALRQEYQASLTTTASGPSTPNPKMPATIPPEALNPSPSRTATRKRAPKDDVLLHRVLDKTYRIQATPHKTPSGQAFHPRHHHHHYHRDDPDSATSSPDIPQPPQLNPDLFSPSTRRTIRHAQAGPRTPRPDPKPGQSVFHTPGQTRGGGTAAAQHEDYVEDEEEENSSDEDEEWKLMSPPKTIQFSIPPNQLLQTPAREASKRIVQHLLHTAGANDTTTTMPDPHEAADIDADEGEEEEDDDVFEGTAGEPTSPMVIRGKRGGMVDDTF